MSHSPEIISLVDQVVALVVALAKLGEDIVSTAPNFSTPLRRIMRMPQEQVGPQLLALMDVTPETEREKLLQALLVSLTAIKGEAEGTKWKIDRRVQPEGVPRKEREFKSAFKRKPRWP